MADVDDAEVAAGAADESPRQLRLQLDNFEGPLELLLTLIEQHRLPITQVSLASLADQYLQHVHDLPELDPDLLADFLSIAGKLLLLKSRALLLTETADPAVEESATDLERRLAEYRLFRAAAAQLQDLELQDQRAYLTRREPEVVTVEAPLAPLAPDALLQAWRRMLRAPAPQPKELELVPRVSVEERRERILALLETQAQVSFLALAGSSVDEVVATFLAALELYRRGRVDVTQPEPFGDLLISRPTADLAAAT